MTPQIEIRERRRRIVLDWVLAGAIVACLSAFFDLRATVNAQTAAFQQVTTRLDGVETREKNAPNNVATKADVDRLERRIDKLTDVLLQDRRLPSSSRIP